MTPQLKNSELDKIVKVIKQHQEVEQAILFGSRATGKAKPNSDIDICLKGKDVTSLIQNTIASDLDELPLPYFFDVINFDTINNDRLKQHISERGIDLLQFSDILL
jgi:predicted nucleotidyltransferase